MSCYSIEEVMEYFNCDYEEAEKLISWLYRNGRNHHKGYKSRRKSRY